MPGELPSRNNEQYSDAEKRELTTAAIGSELDTLFDRHADSVSQGEDDTKTVLLRKQLSTETAIAHITLDVDEEGNRSAFMWTQRNGAAAYGSEVFRYVDGPGVSPSFEPYTIDERGDKVPLRAEQGSSYNPNDDHQMAYMADVWVDNLRELPAIDPNSREAEGKKERKGLLRLLGKFASR